MICVAAVIVLTIFRFANGEPGNKPEQIHLSYGETVNDMVVTWSTMKKTQKQPCVQYSLENEQSSDKVLCGTSKKFTDGGLEKRAQYIHKVTLPSLKRNSTYLYRCGSDETGWSMQYSFSTPPEDNDWKPHLAIFGDMGLVNYRALPRLKKEVASGMYDAVFHIGDIAYDMDEENGRTGDKFMNLIQPVAANVPYMTCVGNHESQYNFSHYVNRFSMPGGDHSSVIYTIDLGPLHIISISTEVYYYTNYGKVQIRNQYEILERDLEEASKPENRKKRPWIIIMGHRPMYCSNTDGDDCTRRSARTRVDHPGVGYSLEKLLKRYGVDLAVWAHEHSYERLWPLYDFQVLNGSKANPYTNPKAPVHFTTGSAGSWEDTDDFMKPSPKWSAFRSSDYGSSRLKAYNASHLHIEQVSDDLKGAVIDSWWLIKDHHGPY